MADIKCGIQLYTLREKCATIQAIDSTLAELAGFGVKDIQISGIGAVDWGELASTVKKHGMSVCVTHTPFERMLKETDTVIDEHLALGCDCIGIGCMPGEYERTTEGTRKFISDILPVAKRMRERGLHLAYHNHNFDLMPLDGGDSIVGMLLKEVDPDLLWFIPDVAWIQIAGFDPYEYLKAMAGRVKVLHFKDYTVPAPGEHAFTELGKGVVDFDRCLAAACELNIPYIMFEQDDNWTVSDMESCRESFDFMQKLLARN